VFKTKGGIAPLFFLKFLLSLSDTNSNRPDGVLTKDNKMKIRNIYISSLTSLAVISSAAAFADEGAYVPQLEGGFTGSVGTFLVTPASDIQRYILIQDEAGNTDTTDSVNPGYQLGIDASFGYIFADTANSVEVFFRNITTSDKSSTTGLTEPFDDIDTVYGDLGYKLDSFDLMFSQFINLGEVMQLKLSGGLAYVDLQRSETAYAEYIDTNFEDFSIQTESKFQGWGPRVGIDTRYGFGDDIEGLGIVGGGSMAYFLGDMDSSTINVDANEPNSSNNPGNHAVLNFRANLGIDYVFFFDNDEGSTLGLELGYLIDYYDDALLITNDVKNEGGYGKAANDYAPGFFNVNSNVQSSALSFAGPYLNLKGVF
jgi:hypothetical protein